MKLEKHAPTELVERSKAMKYGRQDCAMTSVSNRTKTMSSSFIFVICNVSIARWHSIHVSTSYITKLRMSHNYINFQPDLLRADMRETSYHSAHTAQENHLQDGLMVHVVGHLQRGHPAACRECLLVAPDGPYAESTPPPAAQLTPAPAMTASPMSQEL